MHPSKLRLLITIMHRAHSDSWQVLNDPAHKDAFLYISPKLVLGCVELGLCFIQFMTPTDLEASQFLMLCP